MVKLQDGSMCPFRVPSSLTLQELHELVSDKLQCNLKLLQLYYRLDIDKQSHTSIRSEEEFEIFMDRMRKHHLPAKLANGKMSTRIPKLVTAFFEDGIDGDSSSLSRTSQSKGKKVCSLHLF
jgi:hypothetical protein